jgi:hypothetical protein
LIEIPAVPVGTKFSRWRPQNKKTFLKKVQSFSDTLYMPTLRNTHKHEDGTECSETSEYKIQTPGNHPEENIQQDNSCRRLIQEVDL